MWSKNTQKHLEKILNHPGLSFKKINKYKYLLYYNELKWFLWPRSGRYQKISSEGVVSEMYIGELKDFYHRYLTGELDFSENFGKTWSKEDDDILYDMIDMAYTCRQIADELKRHPKSVAIRLVKYFDDESLHKLLAEDMFDVAVKELVDWR